MDEIREKFLATNEQSTSPTPAALGKLLSTIEHGAQEDIDGAIKLER